MSEFGDLFEYGREEGGVFECVKGMHLFVIRAWQKEGVDRGFGVEVVDCDEGGVVVNYAGGGVGFGVEDVVV